MKKRFLSLFLALALMGGMVFPVQAETFYGDPNWSVVFTSEKKMESNFKTADLDEAISGLQPGDNIIFRLTLRNDYEETTDWWMTNKVLYSLEDRSANSATGGGAYTYILTYTDRNGNETVLFSSDTVGGEDISAAGEGLHEATDALTEYFYLDTLSTGQAGSIMLEVALDGETQGNDYQDTLADLQMNFAVELNAYNPPPVVPTDDTPPTSPPDGKKTNIVKTGDESNLTPYFIAMGVSGVLILFLAIYSMKQNKKEKREAE